MSAGGENNNPRDAERLTRLEEHVGFAEHTIDQLAGEIAELHKRLAAMVRRLDALDERMGALASGDGEAGPPVERPPHAAGPAPE